MNKLDLNRQVSIWCEAGTYLEGSGLSLLEIVKKSKRNSLTSLGKVLIWKELE